MKRNTSLDVLKKYIRIMLEAKVSGGSVAGSGAALLRTQSNSGMKYVLYDPKAMVDLMKQPEFYSFRFSTAELESAMLGYCGVRVHSGDCNNAFEIARSAAVKGYGPLMHDIVMSDADNGIVPDRVHNSPGERGIYKHYFDKRGDVDKNKLEKCPMFDEPDAEFLDYSYDGAGEGGTKAKLLQRHEDVLKQVEEHGQKPKVFEKILVNLADQYFDRKFDDPSKK